MADILPGGKADNVPPSAFPRKKVEEGAKFEAEHTKSKAIQKEIARDHLVEDPNYYAKLRKIEKKAMLGAFSDELQKICVGRCS